MIGGLGRSLITDRSRRKPDFRGSGLSICADCVIERGDVANGYDKIRCGAASLDDRRNYRVYIGGGTEISSSGRDRDRPSDQVRR